MDSAQHSTSQDRVRGEGNPKELDSQGASGGEVIDNMIEACGRQCELMHFGGSKNCDNHRRYISALSGKGKDLTIDVQIRIQGNSTKIATTVLVDSRCTSSAIIRAFVKKHNIPTHATAAPIPVYNADGTRNQGGSITRYAEIPPYSQGPHRTNRLSHNRTQRQTDIPLAMTGLARHNPIIIGSWGIDICKVPMPKGSICVTRCRSRRQVG